VLSIFVCNVFRVVCFFLPFVCLLLASIWPQKFRSIRIAAHNSILVLISALGRKLHLHTNASLGGYLSFGYLNTCVCVCVCALVYVCITH